MIAIGTLPTKSHSPECKTIYWLKNLLILSFSRCIKLLIILLFISAQPVLSQTVSLSDVGCDPHNATSCIQDLLQRETDTIIFDGRREWTTGPLRLNGLKNKALIFEEGVTLSAREGAFQKTTDALLDIRNCSGIILSGNKSVLKMNKAEYTDGEWRHIISIRQSTDISISGLELRDSGGDGIYIAGLGKGGYSQNVSIQRVRSINNKRQGMSLISVSGLRVEDSSFESSNGTLPEAGLDLEPNSPDDRLEGIYFKNCQFINNQHAGILFALHKLNSSSREIGVTFEKCILSGNHRSEDRHKAAEIYVSANKTSPVRGLVQFRECVVKESDWGMLFSRKRADAFSLEFIDCAAINICQNGEYPPIALEVTDYKNPSYLGGIDFGNLFIYYRTAVPVITIRGSLHGGMLGLMNIHGNLWVDNPRALAPEYINYLEGGNKDVGLVIQRAQ